MARSAARFTKPQVKREARSVLCHILVVDLTFEQSENVTITRGIQAAALGLWSVVYAVIA